MKPWSMAPFHHMTADGYFGLYGPPGIPAATVPWAWCQTTSAAALRALQLDQYKRWEQPIKTSGFKPD